MHAFITGGCGFIGSHLAERLVAAGHRVTILDDLSSGRREHAPATARLLVGDVADAHAVADAMRDADTVFHLAAVASVERCEREPEATYRTNVDGMACVLDTAAQRRIPVIYASSAAVYGDSPRLPLRETEPAAPLSAYGRHKLANEQLAQAYAQQHGIASTGLRFFNVYGPRQDPRSPYSGVISKFAAATASGEPITFFGDGMQTRDFIYVGDIVSLLLAAATQPSGGAMVLNGCTGHATSLMELAATLSRLHGRPIASHHAPARSKDIRHSLGDPAQAAAQLGFRAHTKLAEGLAHTAGGAP